AAERAEVDDVAPAQHEAVGDELIGARIERRLPAGDLALLVDRDRAPARYRRRVQRRDLVLEPQQRLRELSGLEELEADDLAALVDPAGVTVRLRQCAEIDHLAGIGN